MTDSTTATIDNTRTAKLRPAHGEIVVRKMRVGPFSTTDLRAQLRKAGIDTLLLAGIRTSEFGH
jgi:nicotinamidase-related amidase